MPELDVEVSLEGLDQGLRWCGTSNEHHLERRRSVAGAAPVLNEPEEDGGHAGTEVHMLLLEEFGQTFGVEPWTRHDEFGARRGRGIRKTPCTRVELRHDRKNRGRPAQVEHVRHRDAHRVKDRGPVAVQRSLRIPRGPGRVTQGRGSRLVELGPGVRSGAPLDELLIRDRVRQ